MHAGLLVVSLLCALPIWVCRFLPLLDDSNHLSALYVWAGLRDAASPLHQYYAPRFALVPYFLHYGLGYLFTYVASVEVAHKLALTTYVLGFSVAAWCWCARTNRSAWIAIPVPALAYGVSWAHGYHAFNIGVPVVLLALAAFDRLLAEFRWSSLLLAVVASAACYLSHAVIAALLIGMVPLLAVIHMPTRRALVAAGGVWLCTVATFVLAARQSTSGSSAWLALLNDGALHVSIARVLKRSADFTRYAFDVVAGPWDEVFGGLMVVLVMARHVLAWRHAPTLRGRAWFLEHRALVLMLALVFLYLLGPEHLRHPEYMWIFAGRFVPLALFFLLLAEPRRSAPPAVLSAGLAVVALAFTATIGSQYLSFGRALEPLPRVLDACPKGATVLTLGMRPFSHSSVHVDALGGRIAGWVQVLHGGFDPFYFPRRVAFPFAVVKTMPTPRWRQPERYTRALRDGKYECVLAHRLRAPLADRNYELALRVGDFQLWRDRRQLRRPLGVVTSH